MVMAASIWYDGGDGGGQRWANNSVFEYYSNSWGYPSLLAWAIDVVINYILKKQQLYDRFLNYIKDQQVIDFAPVQGPD